MEDIRIRITGDASALKPTIDQLEKLGTVDAKNSAQFQENAKKHSAALGDMGTETGRLERKMQSLGERIVAAFAVEKILEWGKECVDAFEEAEKAAFELKFAIEQLGKGSKKAFDELIDQTEQLSKNMQAMFTPKQIQQVDAMLARIGLTADQIKKLNPIMINMAVTTGKSLNEVGQALDQAFSTGRMMQLQKQFGIYMKATGDQIQDVNNFLKNSVDYSSASEEALSTLAAQSQKTSGQIEMSMEKVGSVIGPILEKLKLMGAQTLDWATGGKAGTAAPVSTDDEGTAEQDRLDKKNKTFAAIDKLNGKEVKSEDDKASKLKNINADLTKFTTKQLQDRLEAAKDSDQQIIDQQNLTQGILQKFNERGFQNEASRIEKELKLREEAAKKRKDAELKEFDEQYKRALKQADKIEQVRGEGNSPEQKLKYQYDKTIQEMGIQDKKVEDLTDAEYQALTTLTQKYYADLKKIEDEERDKQLKSDQTNSDQRYKAKQSMLKAQKLDTSMAEEKYQVASDKIELQHLEDELDLLKQYGKDTVDQEQKIADQKLKIKEDEATASKKLTKDTIDQVKTTVSAMSDLWKAAQQNQMDAIDHQEDLTQKSIDVQTALASAGKANTLAEEQKHQSDLEAQRLKAQKQMLKIKELEILMNAISSFSESDPKTSMLKAGVLMLAVKGAESQYMEHGGLLDSKGLMSSIALNGMGRRHPGGGDVLVHAQTGEGMLSRRNIANLGGPAGFMDFKKMLDRGPLTEMAVPMAAVMNTQLNTKSLEKKIDELRSEIHNLPSSEVKTDGKGVFTITTRKGGIIETEVINTKTTRI